MNWELSPSELSLYLECRRCFYLKMRGMAHRPRPPMPRIFGTIYDHVRFDLQGMRTELLAAGMPNGIFCYAAERSVKSAAIVLPGRISTCALRGRFHNLLELDAGGYALADVRICSKNDVPLFGHQLHALSWCLEHPAPGSVSFGQVKEMGSLLFLPDHFFRLPFFSGALAGRLHWVEIPRDDCNFLEFLSGLVELLDCPATPDGAPDCLWCR